MTVSGMWVRYSNQEWHNDEVKFSNTIRTILATYMRPAFLRVYDPTSIHPESFLLLCENEQKVLIIQRQIYRNIGLITYTLLLFQLFGPFR